jgi:hypothetical protein
MRKSWVAFIGVVLLIGLLACSSFDGDSGASPMGTDAGDGGSEAGLPPISGTPIDAFLSGLSLSVAAIEPAFTPDGTVYNAGPIAISAVFGANATVTATARTRGAQIKVNGAPTASGSASSPVALKVGPNPIDIAVAAPDGVAQKRYVIVVTGVTPPSPSDYFKAGKPRVDADFGSSVAVSGTTLVVGSPKDSSSATGVNGNDADTSAPGAGAAHVFVRNGGKWSLQAYLKASNTRANTSFGGQVAISGETLVVSARGEQSNATGVNNDQTSTLAPLAGAVYVFIRTGTTWSQQAYIKASNTRAAAGFGASVAVFGNTLAVGSSGESSSSPGINGNQSDASAQGTGAAYVFTRTGTTWSQQAYIKASTPQAEALFGSRVALSADTLAVGSEAESSKATGVNGGDEADTSMSTAGSVHVFRRTGTTWSQEAYVKASNTQPNTYFGESVALSGDTLAVGSSAESSATTTIDGDQTDKSASAAGATYVFRRSGKVWSQEAYIKAPNARTLARFGYSVALSGDLLAVGAWGESSKAIGVNGNQADTSLSGAGAVYLLARSGTTWVHHAYVKASNPRLDAEFGNALALSGDTLAVGSYAESSSAPGINGNQADTSAKNAGAVYVFR